MTKVSVPPVSFTLIPILVGLAILATVRATTASAEDHWREVGLLERRALQTSHGTHGTEADVAV